MDNLYYFSLRYDFKEGYELRPESAINDAFGVIGALLGTTYFETVGGTWNIEERNKMGDACKPHLHFHFAGRFDDITSAERFATNARKRFQRAEGYVHTPRCYSFKHQTDVRDVEAFFRYPLKMIDPRCKLSLNVFNPEVFKSFLPEYDLKFQCALAREELAKAGEIMNKNRDKSLSRQTTYERMIDACTAEQFANRREIFRWVLSYLDSEGIPPDGYKIKSYVNGLALRKGIISPDEFYGEIFP